MHRIILIRRQFYKTPSRGIVKIYLDMHGSMIFSVENRKFFSQRTVNKVSAISFAE